MPRPRLLTTVPIIALLASAAAFAAINDPLQLDTGMISGIAGNSPELRVYNRTQP
jgi:hypothetical protein